MPATLTPPETDCRTPDMSEDDRLPMRVVDRTMTAIPDGVSSRSKAIVVLTIAAVAILLSWSIGTPVSRSQSTPNSVYTSLPRHVFSLGRLEPEGGVIEVAGPSGSSDARIDQILVRVGETVQRGQVLAVLDNHKQLRATLAVAESIVEQARQKLTQTETTVRTTMSELQAAWESKQSQLKVAKLEFERTQWLFQQDATSKQAFEQASLVCDTAKASLREAESRLSRYSSQVESSVDVAVARSELAVAKASMEEAASLLEQGVIRAPVDGAVLDVNLRAGEGVGRTPLLIIGRTQSMMVHAEVYESDVPKLEIGQAVRVTGPALPDVLMGRVEFIASIVQKQSVVDAMPAANTDARVVEVLVRLEPASSELASRLVGMQVRVEFQP